MGDTCPNGRPQRCLPDPNFNFLKGIRKRGKAAAAATAVQDLAEARQFLECGRASCRFDHGGRRKIVVFLDSLILPSDKLLHLLSNQKSRFRSTRFVEEPIRQE